MPAALQISATGTPALDSPSNWRISLCVNRERLIGCSVSECLCGNTGSGDSDLLSQRSFARLVARRSIHKPSIPQQRRSPHTDLQHMGIARRSARCDDQLSVLRRSPLMPRRYEIPSTPQNMVWGYLDSSTPHVLEVSSGDTVTLHSFPSGGKETLPDDINLVPSDYLAALETLPPGPGSHFITR